MKRLLISILLLLMLAPAGALAQLDPVNIAIMAIQKEDWAKAKSLLDKSAEDSVYSQKARTWFFRGYVYKELYKQEEAQQSELATDYRSTAITSMLKSLEIEPNSEFEGDAKQTVRYLAAKIYNEAVTSLDNYEFEVAQKNYDRWKELSLITDPDKNFLETDISFLLGKASKYSTIYDDSTIEQKPLGLSENITKSYLKVLNLDSNNVKANYNLAIHYYNQGVQLIESIEVDDIEFDELFEMQNQVIAYFKKSLPYMLKAYQLEPCRKATIQGLVGIYYGLNEIEKSEDYKKKLEELENGDCPGNDNQD